LALSWMIFVTPSSILKMEWIRFGFRIFALEFYKN
jgi:hypothetical protein